MAQKTPSLVQPPPKLVEEIVNEYSCLLSSQLQEQCAISKRQAARQKEQFEAEQAEARRDLDQLISRRDEQAERVAKLKETIE